MNNTTSNENRPPRIVGRRLRRLVIRSVKSMTTLNKTDKLVWLEIFHLDQTDDGCYLGLADIAERCGITERTAKDSRLRLKRRGFVINQNRVGIGRANHGLAPGVRSLRGGMGLPPHRRTVLPPVGVRSVTRQPAADPASGPPRRESPAAYRPSPGIDGRPTATRRRSRTARYHEPGRRGSPAQYL